MSHSVLRHCRAAASSFVIAVSAANAAETAIFVPGWCRNGGDSAQELALLAEAFPGASHEAHPHRTDNQDDETTRRQDDKIAPWNLRDEGDDIPSSRHPVVLSSLSSLRPGGGVPAPRGAAARGS